MTSSAAASYQWLLNGNPVNGQTSQSITVNSAGNYSVQITDAAGCTSVSNSVAVSQSPDFDFTTTANNPSSCAANNGSITVAVVPAGSYAYSLDGVDFSNTSGSFTNLSAGSYTIFVRNTAGCIVQKTQSLSTNNSFTATANATNETACNAQNGSVTITATPAGTYRYYIRLNSNSSFTANPAGLNNNVFSNLAPGSYVARTVGSNGCEFLQPVTINAFTCTPGCTLTANIGNITQPTCSAPNSGSFTITASNGTTPYEYSVNNGAFALGRVVFTNLSAGTYTITVRDANGCQVTLNPVTLTAPATPAAPLFPT